MDYIPKAPQQQPVVPPSYELVKDVTGKPPEPRGTFILIDANNTQVKMPHAPNKKCKQCYGRGFIGMNAKNRRVVICTRCYKI